MVNIKFGNDLKLILTALLLLLSLPVLQTVVDIGPGVTHQNHEDTISTQLPGNCGNPGCPYPDCGGCGGQPQITLEPTVIIPTIPYFGGTVVIPNTPEVPHPTPCGVTCATVFPTFQITGVPTAINTAILPTIAPTLVVPTVGPLPL